VVEDNVANFVLIARMLGYMGVHCEWKTSGYEVEDVKGGVRSRIHPKHIEEEAANLRNTDSSQFYGEVKAPTLILRATKGMLAEDDLVLPADVAEQMVREIPNARKVDVEGTQHYSILFQPHSLRDQALLGFL
jgi:pimeloyl-ACP methyl ester carboxylesterase